MLNFEDVISNYHNHPSFNFSELPWHIDEKLLEDFGKNYGANRTYLSKARFSKSISIMGNIFDQLEQQANLNEEKLFLKELRERVLDFISDEFKYRKKISNRRPNSKAKNNLETDGYLFINLPETGIKKIQELGEPLVEKFRKNASEGRLTRSDLSDSGSPEIGEIAKLLDEMFDQLGIFKLISEYVGIEYNHTGLSLELSVAGSTWWKDTINSDNSPSTMYAHLDESVYLPKAIVYLSDVSEVNGPTSCYPKKYDELNVPIVADIIGRVIGQVGKSPDSPLHDYYQIPYHQTFGSEKFRKHFMKLPPKIRMNSHFGWDVLKGGKIDTEMAASEVLMLGAPGKTIVFDGAKLLHRGGLIEQNQRLVMQVIFYPKISFKRKLKEKVNSMRVKI